MDLLIILMLVHSFYCTHALLADGRIAWWTTNEDIPEPNIIDINAIHIAADPKAKILVIVTDDNRLLVYCDFGKKSYDGPKDITFWARKRGYSQELIQDVQVEYVQSHCGSGFGEICSVVVVSDISIRLLSVNSGGIDFHTNLVNYLMYPIGFDLININCGHITVRTNYGQLQLMKSNSLYFMDNGLDQFTSATGYPVQDIVQIMCGCNYVLFLMNDAQVFVYGIDSKIFKLVCFPGGTSITKVGTNNRHIAYLDTEGNLWYQPPNNVLTSSPIRLMIFDGMFVENIYSARLWSRESIFVQYQNGSDRRLGHMPMFLLTYGQEYVDGKKPEELALLGNDNIVSIAWSYENTCFVLDSGLVYQLKPKVIEIPFFRKNPIRSQFFSQRIRSALSVVDGKV